MTVMEERASVLDTLTLDEGAHPTFESGHCAMEVVAWLAGEGHTDAPECASKVLRRYTIALNDRWSDERRQTLIPYLPRMVGTGGDGKDALRERIAAEFLSTRLLGAWLDLAGMGDQMATLEGKSGLELRTALWKIRDVAWAKRRESRAELERKVRAHLASRPDADAVAVAVADAAAVAVADAVADAAAVAVADAVAVAVAAADADAVAAAVAAAVADAVAAADADAVAAADAAAVAAAVADAVAGPVDWWGKPYSAAYKAASDYYKANPLPVMAAVEDLAAKQAPLALELLEALIDPEAVSA